MRLKHGRVPNLVARNKEVRRATGVREKTGVQLDDNILKKYSINVERMGRGRVTRRLYDSHAVGGKDRDRLGCNGSGS